MIDMSRLKITLVTKNQKSRKEGDKPPMRGFAVPALALPHQIPDSMCAALKDMAWGSPKDTDAYVLSYITPDDHPAQHQRLSKDTAAEERSEIKMWAFILDFDRKTEDGNKKPHKTRQDAVEGVSELRSIIPELRDAWIIASSLNGYRAVFVLSRYLTTDEWASLTYDFYSRYGEGENLMITPTLKLDRLKDWTRLMRVPMGFRDCVKGSDNEMIYVETNDDVPRLNVDDYCLTRPPAPTKHAGPKRNTLTRGTASADEPPTVEWMECEFHNVPQIFMTEEEARKISRNNHLYKTIQHLLDALETASLEEILWRLLPMLSSFQRVSRKDPTKKDYIEEAWDIITRSAKQRERLPAAPPLEMSTAASYATQKDVTKAMSEKGEELSRIRSGAVLLNTPPGSSKSTMLLTHMKSLHSGCIWLSASRDHRDEMLAKFADTSAVVRMSNEEILEEVLGERFVSGKMELAMKRFSTAYENAKKAAFYGTGFEDADGVSVMPDGNLTSLFVWMLEKRYITAPDSKACRKLRNDNDSAVTKARYIFATHDSLMPMLNKFREATRTDPKDLEKWAKDKLEAEAEVAEWRGGIIRGTDEQDRAEEKLRKLNEKDIDPLSGRWIIFDEAKREHLMDPELFYPEAATEVMNTHHKIKMYDPWHKADKAKTLKFLKGHIKDSVLVLCSADGGFTEAAAVNNFEFTAVLSLDIKLKDNDLILMLAKLSTRGTTLTAGAKAKLKRLFDNGEKTAYRTEYQKILDDNPRRIAVDRARMLAPNYAKIITSGKASKASTEVFLETEEIPLSKLNTTNVVGSNDFPNSLLISFVSHPTPQQIGFEMRIGGLTEEQAIKRIVVDTCDQVASRNTGCRGVEWVKFYWDTNRQEHQALNNAHFMFIDSTLKGVVKDLLIHTDHAYHATSDLTGAPELTKRFYGIHA